MQWLIDRLIQVSYIIPVQLFVDFDWYRLSCSSYSLYIAYHRTLLGLHIFLVAADVVASTPLTDEAMTVADIYLIGIRDIVCGIDEPRFTRAVPSVRSIEIDLEATD